MNADKLAAWAIMLMFFGLWFFIGFVVGELRGYERGAKDWRQISNGWRNAAEDTLAALIAFRNAKETLPTDELRQ